MDCEMMWKGSRPIRIYPAVIIRMHEFASLWHTSDDAMPQFLSLIWLKGLVWRRALITSVYKLPNPVLF